MCIRDRSMPLCARESSPGFGVEPPPDKPADEIVWCGLLKVLFKISGWSVGKSPAIECIFVTSKASSNERSGSIDVYKRQKQNA